VPHVGLCGASQKAGELVSPYERLGRKGIRTGRGAICSWMTFDVVRGAPRNRHRQGEHALGYTRQGRVIAGHTRNRENFRRDGRHATDSPARGHRNRRRAEHTPAWNAGIQVTPLAACWLRITVSQRAGPFALNWIEDPSDSSRNQQARLRVLPKCRQFQGGHPIGSDPGPTQANARSRVMTV